MATCSAPATDNTTSGDDLYGARTCWQEFVNWAWSAYGFQNDFWDDGFGYEDPCNRNLPLNRTMNALWVLCYSADDYNNDAYSNNCLHWARRYTWNQIDSLRSRCGDGTLIGEASGSNVDLFLGFWYEYNAVSRAAMAWTRRGSERRPTTSPASVSAPVRSSCPGSNHPTIGSRSVRAFGRHRSGKPRPASRRAIGSVWRWLGASGVWAGSVGLRGGITDSTS